MILKFVVDFVDGQAVFLDAKETSVLVSFCLKLLQIYSSHNIGKVITTILIIVYFFSVPFCSTNKAPMTFKLMGADFVRTSVCIHAYLICMVHEYNVVLGLCVEVLLVTIL